MGIYNSSIPTKPEVFDHALKIELARAEDILALGATRGRK